MKELLQRVLVALILVPLVLGVLWLGGIFFQGLVFLAVGLALAEFLRITVPDHWGTLLPPMLLLSGWWIFFPHWAVFSPLGWLLFFGLYLPFFSGGMPFPALALASFGTLYVGYMASFAVRIREEGFPFALSLFLLVWVYDTAAYFLGRLMGRHRLAPRISPGKTIEGTVGGLAVAALFALLLARWGWLPPRSPALVGLLVGVAAQLGDLFESALKRHYGLKDSSHLLPGHGGMLDRVDSLLFAMPTYFLLLKGGLL